MPRLNIKDIQEQYQRTLNRLAKWRAVFAGWQLGTRPKGDPESDALRDHREATMLLRAELTALSRVLILNGVIRQDEYMVATIDEAEHLMRAYEARFPGYRAIDDGMEIDAAVARETSKGWKP